MLLLLNIPPALHEGAAAAQLHMERPSAELGRTYKII